MKRLLMTLIMATAVTGLAISANAQKKIGMKKAQAIAVANAPGLRLKAKELENEKGSWIYSFEFLNKNGSIREVNVNAYTGAVVVEHETKKQDAAEEKAEKKGKH